MAGSYLDEIHKKNLEFIDALGAADTAVKKAAATAKLLPRAYQQAKERGILERLALSTKAVQERQKAQEANAPVPAQDELPSMAPPETRLTGAGGMGMGGGGGGIGELQEILSGGGAQVQPAGARTEAAPGYKAVTETTTRPGSTGYPLIDMALRRKKPQALGTITSTATRVERDPVLFQANVTTTSAAMEGAFTYGRHEEFAKHLRSLESAYGTPYAMEVARLAKQGYEANQVAKLQAIEPLSRAYMEAFELTPSEATTAARAAVMGDLEARDRALKDKTPLSRQKTEAEIAAAQALADQRRAAAAKLRSETGGKDQINALGRDNIMFGYSMVPALTSKYAGESGAVGPEDVFRAMSDCKDKDGNIKPGYEETVKGIIHWWGREGAMWFPKRDRGLLASLASKGIGSLWEDEQEGTILGIDQLTELFIRGDHQTLSELGIGKRVVEKQGGREVERFKWAWMEDPMGPTAEQSRGFYNWLRFVKQVGGDYAPPPQGGAAERVREAKEPKPKVQVGTPTGPAPAAAAGAPQAARSGQAAEMNKRIGARLAELGRRIQEQRQRAPLRRRLEDLLGGAR